MLTNVFEKKYVKYLNVYKTPISPGQLDPNVFYFPETGEAPKLQQSIHSQIIRDLEQFAGNQPHRIKEYYLVGPVTNPRSKNRNGDLKVIILLNKHLMDIDVDGLLAEEILKMTKHLSGRLAVGTGRKIVYSPTIRDIDPSNHPGVYDISKFCWTKIPEGVA